MISDYHIHTYLCKHARGEIHEYVEAARKAGLNEICFTDHAPAPDGYDLKHRMEMDKYPFYRDTIKELRRTSKQPSVLFGVEADYYEGCEKFLKPWLVEQDFDLVIGSIHYIENWGIDNPDELKIWDSVDIADTWKEYFTLIGKMADTGMYDIVGHIDITKKFGHKPEQSLIPEIVKPALDRIAAAGMAIELNTSGLRKKVCEIYPSLLLLKMACQRNIPICFGSDSHQPDEPGRDFDKALKLAKQAGYTHYTRFNRRKQIPTPLP